MVVKLYFSLSFQSKGIVFMSLGDSFANGRHEKSYVDRQLVVIDALVWYHRHTYRLEGSE